MLNKRSELEANKEETGNEVRILYIFVRKYLQ